MSVVSAVFFFSWKTPRRFGWAISFILWLKRDLKILTQHARGWGFIDIGQFIWRLEVEWHSLSLWSSFSPCLCLSACLSQRIDCFYRWTSSPSHGSSDRSHAGLALQNILHSCTYLQWGQCEHIKRDKWQITPALARIFDSDSCLKGMIKIKCLWLDDLVTYVLGLSL